MKTGSTLDNLIEKLAYQHSHKLDLVVPAKLMHCETRSDSQCDLVVARDTGPARYHITDHACAQMAKKLDIPYAYFKRMREFAPELLDYNVNSWLQRNLSDTYMVRTLDWRARAFLSNRYRKLDNFDLAKSVVPVLRELPGARFESVALTESKLYLKVVSERVQCEVAPGDIVQAGVIVSNSEIGSGSLRVEPLIYRLKCSNGLIAADRSLRKYHAGKQLIADDDLVVEYQADTLAARDAAVFLQVRDMVRTAVSDTTLQLISDKMRTTMGIALTGDLVRTVEVLGDRYALTEEECAGVLRHLFDEHDRSGYGLVNAVTGYSQEVDDYDRATELEEIGGKMLDLSGREWRRLAEAV